MMCVDISFI